MCNHELFSKEQAQQTGTKAAENFLYYSERPAIEVLQEILQGYTSIVREVEDAKKLLESKRLHDDWWWIFTKIHTAYVEGYLGKGRYQSLREDLAVECIQDFERFIKTAEDEVDSQAMFYEGSEDISGVKNNSEVGQWLQVIRDSLKEIESQEVKDALIDRVACILVELSRRVGQPLYKELQHLCTFKYPGEENEKARDIYLQTLWARAKAE